MSFLRLSVIIASLMLAAACGSETPSQPAAPSPAPAPTPAPSPTPPPSGSSSAIAIPANAATLGNRAFVPPDLNVAIGTTVIWTNTDSVTHTSTSDAAGWDSGAIVPGGQFSFAFQTAGTFPYHCVIHPGMVGSIVVR